MSIADVPNSLALPATAQMKLKPSAVPAKRTRLSIQPYQRPIGQQSTSQLIQFYLPARKGSMFDPKILYVKGTITNVANDGGAGGTLNRNAFTIFNRLQVYGQDSTLLEDIQNYNDLCHTVMDAQMSREDKYALSTMWGGAYTTTTATSASTVGGADFAHATCTTTTTIANNIDVGHVFADAGASLNFTLPVVSAFGLLADTLIPVGWLNSDLRIDFYTETALQAIRSTLIHYGTGYELKNLELVVDYIDFDPSSMEYVNQYAPKDGPLYSHSSTWKCYTDSIGAGQQGFYTHIVPHRSLSVKQVLSSAHLPRAQGFDPFSRILPYAPDGSLTLGLNIGGQKFPQKPIMYVSEAFAELQKSFHAFDQLVMNGSINATEYTYFADTAASSNSKPVIGFDTEIYDKKGSTIVNGQNWTGLNVFIEGQIENSDGTATTAVITRNTWVNFDVIYVYNDGILSVRF